MRANILDMNSLKVLLYKVELLICNIELILNMIFDIQQELNPLFF